MQDGEKDKKMLIYPLYQKDKTRALIFLVFLTVMVVNKYHNLFPIILPKN